MRQFSAFFYQEMLKILFAIFFFLVAVEAKCQDSTAQKSCALWLKPSDSLNKTRLQLTAATLTTGYGVALLGLNELWYKGYPRSTFHFADDLHEWQQLDKAGHMVTAYLEARYVGQVLVWTGVAQRDAALWAGLTAFMLQNTIEVFDGFSAEWGASASDIAANFIGAAAMTGQEIAWNEQRIMLKVMPRYLSYDQADLQQRADMLYGKSAVQRFIKDYNAINVWASINTASFFPQQKKLKWLNIAVGYGAGGMFGGYKNEWTDKDGLFHNRNDVERYRKLFLSLDVDFHRIPTKSPYLRILLDALNILKVPAPALEWNTKGQLIFHPLL